MSYRGYDPKVDNLIKILASTIIDPHKCSASIRGYIEQRGQ